MINNLRNIIIVIIIIIIIILSILLISFKVNTKSDSTNELPDIEQIVDYENTKMQVVTEKIEYYTVRNCINTYLNALNKESSNYYIANEYNEDMQKEYVYNLLSEEYKNDKNIQINQVFNYINTLDEEEIFIPIKMKVLEKENIKKYVSYGIVQNLNNEYKRDLYIIVNLDFRNRTYSIEPINNIYNSIDEIDIENNNITINKNDYNTYKKQTITNEYVTNEYFLLYKKLSLSKPEIIYNLMSNNYRQKRFGSLENFKEYINDNETEIAKISLSEYIVNNHEDYIEYVAKDQFENLYIINEYRDQTIEIKLDTYTLMTDKFKESYQKADDIEKVQMNVDKFVKMINRHDYISSYNCIANSFKNNYFSEQEEFEKYVKDRFFDYNKIQFKNIEKKGNNIYVVDIQIKDLMENNSEIKDISIIIKLNDDFNFEMSFTM